MQQALKSAAGLAWARIVPTEFLEQFLVPMDHADAALDLGFRRVAAAPLAHGRETSVRVFDRLPFEFSFFVLDGTFRAASLPIARLAHALVEVAQVGRM